MEPGMADDNKPERPAIAMQPVKSSALEEVGYDEASSTLAVKFKHGATHYHAGVPQELFHQLLTAPSIGSFYSSSIRGKFKP
jgi:hypothetical protein